MSNSPKIPDMPEPVDLSALDPTSDPIAWEERIAQIVDPPLDFGSLNPTGSENWEAGVQGVLDALETEDALHRLQGFSGETLESAIGHILDASAAPNVPETREHLVAHLPMDRQTNDESEDAPATIVTLAPRALSFAAALAAAAWLIVWAIPRQPRAIAETDPEMAVMEWAESGDASGSDALEALGSWTTLDQVQDD